MNERRTAIVEYIAEHGRTEVGVLSEKLQVSKVTLRKDLNYLAERGVLRRERGYAVPSRPEDINYHMAFHFSSKQKIAQAAAGCVCDGETVMIESSSTCSLFAEELAKNRQNITIVTNSLYLANYVRGYSSVQVILLGGTLQPQSQSLVGPLTREAVRSFHVDKMFTGTDGYSRDFGFTGDDLIRADTLQSMIDAAAKTYVLTTSEKFRRPGAVSFLKFENVHEVITDEGIPPEEKKYLEDKGIRVTIAK